mmetsp:Transcript_11028/g.28910  ORF Transcript_11028/g.28910 Transcript_11028/m.28910 type:complete len:310 (-) Transcript_11028:2183-3112(-)
MSLSTCPPKPFSCQLFVLFHSLSVAIANPELEHTKCELFVCCPAKKIHRQIQIYVGSPPFLAAETELVQCLGKMWVVGDRLHVPPKRFLHVLLALLTGLVTDSQTEGGFCVISHACLFVPSNRLVQISVRSPAVFATETQLKARFRIAHARSSSEVFHAPPFILGDAECSFQTVFPHRAQGRHTAFFCCLGDQCTCVGLVSLYPDPLGVTLPEAPQSFGVPHACRSGKQRKDPFRIPFRKDGSVILPNIDAQIHHGPALSSLDALLVRLLYQLFFIDPERMNDIPVFIAFSEKRPRVSGPVVYGFPKKK